MLDPVDAQDAELLEGPGADAAGELAVVGGDLVLGAGGLDLCVEPRVGEHLDRADNGDAGRVAGLYGADQAQLLAGGE